jgi:hypothetical protein
MIERRRFFRVVFSTPASLQQAGETWTTTLLDLSLQGALLNRPDGWSDSNTGLFTLSFTLAGSDIQINMEVEATHLDEQKLGVYCHHIDIDSASHLRRLIELNAGDTELLLREFAHLLEDHQQHELDAHKPASDA